ncbi:MAG TPA: TonB-dependent receptor [Bryobacteraceae bacterium]|nr:TonB-dependent receptor [Bryobacteraceae bacterium]
MVQKYRGSVAAWAAALLFAALLDGQTTGTGTMVGTVTDTSGAVVAGAKVTVVNTATAFTSEITTGGEGAYYIPYLAPGTYRLSVEMGGFKKYVRDGIVLRTGEVPRIDIQMEVGGVTETVQVTGGVPLLDTETSASGQVLSGDTLVAIPVSQKRPVRMMYYYPGTNSMNGYHVLGQRSRAIGYQVDGVNGKEPGIGNIGGPNEQVSPTQDAFEEVKIHTTGMPAEYGHSAGGLMSMVMKSGTNQLHLALEDRHINKAMIHRNYLEQLPRTNPFNYHERTALFTGPVRIPKIYNGKDRTFFLFGFARHSEIAGTSSARTTVPTPEMLNGDFSFGGMTSPAPLPIYNPFTTAQTGPNTWTRQPFPNNIIPKSMIDPAVANFLARGPFAAPNQAGIPSATGPTENLVVNQPKEIFRTRFDVKLDHQFNSSHKIYGRYSQSIHRAWKGDYQAQFGWRDIDPNAQPQPVDHYNIVFSDMLIISPTVSNEFRAGFNRRVLKETALTKDGDWAKQLGIPNVSGATFPYFNIGFGFAALPSYQNIGEDITIQNNLTKIAGKHTLKGGYELMRTRYNATASDLPGGTYNFGGTNAPFTPNTGNTVASFLLGTVTSATFTSAYASWLPRWWSHQAYFQDDWKVLRSLTLNLGVRYSYETPYQTKYGQQSQFDPTARDPITGQLGAILHTPGPLAKKDLNNFAPRLGLAWNFRPKYVFRASFGMVHQDIFATDRNSMFQEYLATANIQAPVGDPRHVFRLSEGPPAFSYSVQPDGSVPFVGTNYSGRGAHRWDPNMRMPYVMSWSGGIQYAFRQNWVIETQYQGQSGVGLINNWNMNVMPLNISTDTATLNTIFQNQQNYLPFTNFNDVRLFSNFGHNSYHGGTVKLEKRMSNGLTFNSFYTMSKTLTEAEVETGDNGITYYNRRLEKARANYDVRHRFVTVMSYELPFGKGRRWMNGGGVSNAVFGGWQLTWTQTMQSGPPFNVSFAGSPNRYLPGETRPNIVTTHADALVQDWELGANRFPTQAQNPYLNAGSFAYPAAFTAGNLGRNVFEGPGLLWTQLSIAKWWTVKERYRFQVRLDGNNFPIKQPQFGDPNGAFNLNALGAFARIGSATRGSFSDIGTSNSNLLIIGRFEF